MQSTITLPLVYSIELHSANIYNSGFIRMFEDGNIDGILTCDYFFIIPALVPKVSNEMFTLLNLCSLNLVNNEPVSSLFRFEYNNPFSKHFLYTENVAYSIFSSNICISLRILKEITDQKSIINVCRAIDVVKEELSP